jgi:hypothetical protein
LEDKQGMPDLQKRVDDFRKYLMEDIGEPVVVEFDLIPVDMMNFKSQPPEGSGG